MCRGVRTDDEDRDLVEDRHHDHEEILAQRLVQGDALLQVHLAHELPLRLLQHL